MDRWSSKGNGRRKEWCPVDCFRFYFRTLSNGGGDGDGDGEGVNSYMVEIPSNTLDFIRRVDPVRYTSHNHSSRDNVCEIETLNSDRFRRVNMFPRKLNYTHPRLDPVFRSVVLDSFVYILFRDTRTQTPTQAQTDSYLFQSLNLNTLATRELALPNAPNRSNPKAFALCGKIYLLGGLSHLADTDPLLFGEVYNPLSNCWSFLKPPSEVLKFMSMHRVFITSLGDKAGKLMVYDPNSIPTSIGSMSIYDVAMDEWDILPCPALDGSYVPNTVVGMEIINIEDGTIYWLAASGYIYSFDWKAMEVYIGRFIGLERVPILRKLQNDHSSVTFHHLWADIFCLFWSDTSLPRPSATSPTFESHFTFLKMLKDPATHTFTFSVLGCFVDLFHPGAYLLEAIRV